MANRTKRLHQEAIRLQEAEKFTAALRRAEKTPTVSRIRKRRPERSAVVSEVRLQINMYWEMAGAPQLAGYKTPEELAAGLFRSRPLLRALIQNPSYVRNLIVLFLRMEIYRPFDTWRAPKSARPDRVLRSFVLHAFVRYQWSKPLLNAWMECPDMPELLSQFIHMAEGRSFRRMPHLPGHFTSKMAHLTLHAPGELDWQAVPSWAYLCGLGFPASRVRQLYDLGEQHFIVDPANSPLWQFLLKHPELKQEEIQRIICFYQEQQSQKHYITNRIFRVSVQVEPLFSGFNFLGATLASVRRRMHAWEAHVKVIRNAPYIGEMPHADIAGMEYLPEAGHFPVVIRQITNPADLFREGRTMHHCVASYLDDCLKGHCSIWVVRQANSRLATIELRPDKKIYQVKGRFNNEVSDLVKKAVNLWCRHEGLEVMYY